MSIKQIRSMTREYARMQHNGPPGYPGHARFGAAGDPGTPAGPLVSATPPQIQYVQDWFIYEADALGLAPGITANIGIQIQADSDFKLVKLSMAADIAGAAQTESNMPMPNATLQILDTGSGRQLFSAPVPLNALFGSGRLPYILPVPRIFKARTNISLTVASFEAANTNNIRMAFHGNKIFQLGQ